MNIFSLLLTIASVLYVFLGFNVIRMDNRSLLNRLFFALNLSLIIWSFATALYISANDAVAFVFWYKVCLVGCFFFVGIGLHFFFVFAKKENLLKHWWIYIICYLPSIIFSYKEITSDFFIKTYSNESNGWIISWKTDSIWFWSSIAFIIVYVSFCMVISYGINKRATSQRERNQARVLISTSALSLLTGMAIMVLALIPGFNIPDVTPIAGVIWSIGIYYSISKYKLMAMTPSFIAEKLFQTIIDLIVLTNSYGLIVNINPATQRLLGFNQSELVGEPLERLFLLDSQSENTNITELLNTCPVRGIEAFMMSKNGEKIPIILSISEGRDNYNTRIGFVLVSKDITEYKRAAELDIANRELIFQNEEKEKRTTELIIANKELALKNTEISYISYHDFLTGLYNRIFFEEERKRLDTPRQLPISIIMGDINGLKLINDGFGHSKGDELLIEIAKILKSCCREEDIISRIGGDEFGILLPKTDSQSAQQICNRIYNTCKGYALDGGLIYPSISVGHATKTISTETMDNILITAEESMSRRKLLESKSAHSSIMTSIKVMMFEKSQETEEHAARMVQLSKSIGIAMSLTDDQLNELELLATLHDIGKMGVSAEILSKPGKLSDEEWVEMRKHPEVGFRVAQATSELIPIAEYILSHHERWDGKGYPQGLIGEKIPLLSRILAIVDSFDAMTNDRAYRSAMTKEEAIEEIRRNSGTQFDPEGARVFIDLISDEDAYNNMKIMIEPRMNES